MQAVTLQLVECSTGSYSSVYWRHGSSYTSVSSVASSPQEKYGCCNIALPEVPTLPFLFSPSLPSSLYLSSPTTCVYTCMSLHLPSPSFPPPLIFSPPFSPPSVHRPLLQIVYFTATFPYVILVCLFFRAVTLDGAGDGLHFLFLPDSSFKVRYSSDRKD